MGSLADRIDIKCRQCGKTRENLPRVYWDPPEATLLVHDCIVCVPDQHRDWEANSHQYLDRQGNIVEEQ
jgi:hypothetical protein